MDSSIIDDKTPLLSASTSNHGGKCITYRKFLCIFQFFGYIIFYSQRIVVNITIIPMVNHTALQIMLNETDELEENILNGTNVVADGPYVWDRVTQGHILGAFFYGYLVSQLPCGWLAGKYGSMKILLITQAISSVCTLLSPLAADLGGHTCFIIIRVIVGICSGSLFPCLFHFASKWAPSDEKTRMVNLVYSGGNVGILLTMFLGGILCSNIGWRSAYYISGACSFIWQIIWYVIAADDPFRSKFISNDEKAYILSRRDIDSSPSESANIPWKSILTSPTVLGLIITNIVSDWGIYFFQLNMPTYLYEVLNFNMSQNGIFSALPYLCSFLVLNIAPLIADCLITRGVGVNFTRILMNSIGFIGSAIFLIPLCFVTPNQHILAIFYLCSGIALSNFAFSGFLLIPMEIAPQFSALIIGVANGIGSISGVSAPWLTAVMTKHHTYEEWRNVFILTIGIYVFGTFIFNLTSKGHVLPWAKNSQYKET